MSGAAYRTGDRDAHRCRRRETARITRDADNPSDLTQTFVITQKDGDEPRLQPQNRTPERVFGRAAGTTLDTLNGGNEGADAEKVKVELDE